MLARARGDKEECRARTRKPNPNDPTTNAPRYLYNLYSVKWGFYSRS